MNNDIESNGPIKFNVGTKMHPSVFAVMQFFAYKHLPPHLQDVSRLFHDLAVTISDGPQNPETTVALRKLLEAKDAAVRSKIFKQQD